MSQTLRQELPTSKLASEPCILAAPEHGWPSGRAQVKQSLTRDLGLLGVGHSGSLAVKGQQRSMSAASWHVELLHSSSDLNHRAGLCFQTNPDAF